MIQNDIDVNKVAQYITYLNPSPDATKRLDRWGSKWASQKVHCLFWFTQQAQGDARNGSATTANNSALLTYNRIQNTGMLVWLADAFGADEDLIERAVAETKGVKLMKSCSTFFRKVIPFEAIYQLIQQPKLWRYDPAMVGFLVFGDDGYVDESKSDMFHVFKTMDTEWINQKKRKG